MREIKFRAWVESKDGGWFIHNSQMRLYLDGKKEYHLWDDIWEEKSENKITLMQYTGLKDMNGKEIYESDYIRNKLVVFKVIWDIELCAFRALRKDSETLLYELPISEKYWVCGNIYENPELLKGGE